MAKKKTPAPVIACTGTCKVTDYMAQRIWEEGISCPEGMVLTYHLETNGAHIHAKHDISLFYDDFLAHTVIGYRTTRKGKKHVDNRDIYGHPDDVTKANILKMSNRELRDFVNRARQSLRAQMNVARLDLTFGISDAKTYFSDEIRNAIAHDERGNPLDPIGFDIVFLRLAEERSISQREIEEAMWRDVQRLVTWRKINKDCPTDQPLPRNQVIDFMRAGFSNLPLADLRSQFTSHYRNMNQLHDPLWQRLGPINGCIWGATPLATDLIIGDWIYRSSPTPTMLARRILPESVRLGLKGRPVNDLMDTPIFGESQKILHVAELKNGNTTITMTPETVPYAYRPEQVAAKLAA